jgi:hypothetical protein
MRYASVGHGQQAMIESEWEIDPDLFDEAYDGDAFAGIDTDLDDVEPWQRLGDVLGRLTGEAETD